MLCASFPGQNPSTRAVFPARNRPVRTALGLSGRVGSLFEASQKQRSGPLIRRATATTGLTGLDNPGIPADSTPLRSSWEEGRGKLRYECIVFDMDGTMTVSNIDFQKMRQLTGIPQGDLFTVMESWREQDKIDDAYAVILELEAAACLSVQLQPGLIEILEELRAQGAKVALVTRNTTISVNAFFAKTGEHWRDLFSIILTREFRYVKPDKRLLLHVAQEWGVPPSSLLMVGDSREDVECGNAAGSATCLISGGGNEVVSSSTAAVPAKGGAPSDPTFTVGSLSELHSILKGLDAKSEQSAAEAEMSAVIACALKFVDQLLASNTIKAASCSFPRLAGAFGGAAASTRPGDAVLHLGCGDGALTKLLASQGLRVEGVDSDAASVRAALAKGIPARLLTSQGPLLDRARPQAANVVFSFSQLSDTQSEISPAFRWCTGTDADLIWQALQFGGHYAAGHLLTAPSAALSLYEAAQALDCAIKPFLERGFLVLQQSVEHGSKGTVASFVATKPGMGLFKRP